MPTIEAPHEPINAKSLGLGIDLARVETVRRQFADSGTTISAWARDRGFNEQLTHRVLQGRRKCLRGESHRIAVALGIKVSTPMVDGQ